MVVSDLIDEPEPTLRALRLIRSHRHDVIVFHVQDPAELEFPFEGATLFHDLETGEQIEVDPATVRTDYFKQATQLQSMYRRKLREFGIDYETLDLRRPYEHALWSYLQKRASLRK